MFLDDEYFDSNEFKDILTSYEESVSSGAPIFMDTDDLIDIADYYAMSGDHDKAASVIETALDLDPGATLPLVYKAREALDKGDIDRAKELSASIIDKEDPDCKLLEGEILVACDMIEDADRHFTQMAENSTGEEYNCLIYDIANVYLDYGMNEKVLEWCKKSDETADNDILDLKGRALFGLEDYEACVKTYNTLLDKKPRSPRYWSTLANAQFMLGKYLDALTSSDFALALDTEYKPSLLLKANTLCRMGNFKEALEFYNRYNKLAPNDAMSLMNTGKCLLQMGRQDEALDYLRKAAENAEKNNDSLLPDVYETMALAYGMTNDPGNAIKCLEKTITADTPPNIPQTYIMMAHVLFENGKPEDAYKLYSDAIITSGYDPDTILQVLVSLLDNQQMERAYLLFKMFFMSVDENYHDGYSYMALCCWELDKGDEFIYYLEKAVEHNPGEAKTVLSQIIPHEMSAEDYLEFAKEDFKAKKK